MIQGGCKYNVKEFQTFVSGKVRIKPQLADDWVVFTGGFKNSSDVLNLYSKTLEQKIYDCGSDKFFKFMLDNNVTMNGNKIVGKFVIGSQRVLRSEADYQATIGTISERKETLIPKVDWIPGHKYETVCGSNFIFAGIRYTKRIISSKNGLKISNEKKAYFSVGKGNCWPKHGIEDISTKKVVKDLGANQLPGNLEDKFESYGKTKDILYISKEKSNREFKLRWTIDKNISYGYRIPDYITNAEGDMFRRTTSKDSWQDNTFVELEEKDGNWLATDKTIIYNRQNRDSKYETRGFTYSEIVQENV